MAWTYSGLPNEDLFKAKEMFPPDVKVRILKNTQFRKAAEGTGFEEFGQNLWGQNCFVFVEKDTDLKQTIKAYVQINKTYNREERIAEVWEKHKDESKTPVFTTSVGGVMRDEWNIIPAKELPKYQDFPTKTELIAQIAGSIKQVPTKLAVCAKQLPQKTAIGIKKIVEKMEEEGKATVGDVVA